jgi:hypothetical protein
MQRIPRQNAIGSANRVGDVITETQHWTTKAPYYYLN